MALAGWSGWDAEKLRPWQRRILPDGWFLAVHRESDQIVATAMALMDVGEFGKTGGELGWVAADPAHRGQGLGRAVVAAATTRMIAAGYRHVHLYTEPWRLAALKTYLRLGYVPLLKKSDAQTRWRGICDQLDWPFEPTVWQAWEEPAAT
jgi:mycothiol synthase